MKSQTIKQAILDFLSDGKWHWGGTIEDFIRGIYGRKASNASRRCRELENEGKIIAEYERVGEKGNKVVRYKLVEKIDLNLYFREEVVARKMQDKLL